MEETVLVLGASGLFGSHAARAFAKAGWVVRRFQRGSDMVAAAMGAQVIVNGMNPPMYHDWAGQLPKITAAVLGAARASGATVILPCNVYVYGDQPGVWGPDTPQRPVSRKGALRVTMEAQYRAAVAEGVQVILLRGGDFLDVEAKHSLFNTMILRSLSRGKITAGGNPDARHAYAPLPDMARAAVALAEMRGVLPPFSDLPFAGLTFSIHELKAEVERQTGRSFKLVRFPWWVLRLASPFWELARELAEMRYLNDVSHELDAGPLRSLLPGLGGMSLADVVAEHLGGLQGMAMSTQSGR